MNIDTLTSAEVAALLYACHYAERYGCLPTAHPSAKAKLQAAKEQ